MHGDQAILIDRKSTDCVYRSKVRHVPVIINVSTSAGAFWCCLCVCVCGGGGGEC